MPKRDEKVILEDILDNLKFILQITYGLTKEEFFENRIISFATDRGFEIIGEAERQLPDTFIQLHDEVEWNKMISFRNLSGMAITSFRLLLTNNDNFNRLIVLFALFSTIVL